MRINLLPEQYRPEPLINPVRLSVMIVCSVLMFVGVVWLVIQNFQLGSEKERSANLDQQIGSYQGMLREINDYEQRLNNLKQRLAQVEQIKAAYYQYPFVLNRLAGALEHNMWLENVDMPALGQFTVNGKSLIFPTIGGLLKNLQNIPELHEVKLTQVNAVTENDLDFYNFAIKLTPGGGEAANAKTQNK